MSFDDLKYAVAASAEPSKVQTDQALSLAGRDHQLDLWQAKEEADTSSSDWARARARRLSGVV